MDKPALDALRKRQLELQQILEPFERAISTYESKKKVLEELESEIAKHNELLGETGEDAETNTDDFDMREESSQDEQQQARERYIREQRLKTNRTLEDVKNELEDYETPAREAKDMIDAINAGRQGNLGDETETKDLMRDIQGIYAYSENNDIPTQLRFVKMYESKSSLNLEDIIVISNVLHETLQNVEDISEKLWLAKAIGWLDGMATQEYRNEVHKYLGEVGDMAKKCGAVEVDYLYYEFIKLHEKAPPTLTDRTNIGYLMVTAETHGDPRFIINHLRAFSSESPLRESTRKFIDPLRKLKVSKSGYSETVTAKVVDYVGGSARQKEREIVMRENPELTPEARAEITKNRLQAKSQRQEELLSSVRDQFDAVEELKELVTSPGSAAISGKMKDNVFVFALSDGIKALKNAPESTCSYRVDGLASQQEEGDIRFFIEKKPTKNSKGEDAIQYIFLDAASVRTVFETSDDLEKFIKAYVRKVKGPKVKISEFSLARVKPDGLQRCVDSMEDNSFIKPVRIPIHYNWPYESTRVETWSSPHFETTATEVTGTKKTAKSSKIVSSAPRDETGRTHNFSHDFVIITEDNEQCRRQAESIFKKHENETTCVSWSPDFPEEWRVEKGTVLPIDSNARVHILGVERSLSDSVIATSKPASRLPSGAQTPLSPPAGARALTPSSPPAGERSRLSVDAPSKASSRAVSRDSNLSAYITSDAFRPSIRTIADQPMDQLSDNLALFIQKFNSRAQSVETSSKQKGPQTDSGPRQINTVFPHPITGNELMPLAAEGLARGMHRNNIPCKVKATEVPFVFDSSSKKITIGPGGKPESVSARKVIYEVKGNDVMKATRGLPQKYLGEITARNVDEKTITVKLFGGQQRGDAPEQTIHVGDDVSNYKVKEKINVDRTIDDVKVTKTGLRKAQSIMGLGGKKK
ncbi:MAG: hypothetical protein V4568_00005 [Pseudomonadota bacterium]